LHRYSAVTAAFYAILRHFVRTMHEVGAVHVELC
jgi:hypothetical protein